MNTKQLFRAFSLMTPEHWQMALTALTVAVLLSFFSSTVWAFPSYDGCEDCHGGFEVSPYTSLQDGTNWGIDLMQGHWPFVERNCNACHKSGGRGEVFLNLSDDDSLSKSCVGCHGRDEDVTGNCTGLVDSQGGTEAECGSGAGLRQYHESQVGAGTCNGCHGGDASPVGEHIAPFNYGLDGIRIEDSCDDDGTESQFGATGLDNDGDGQRDGVDSDCAANSPPTQPGTLSASMVTASSATVQWGASSDADGDLVSYQVDYRRNGDTPWSDGGSTSATSQQLSGLEAGQSYDARVTPNDGTVNGTSRSALNLFQTESGGSGFKINAAMSDAWFFPETSGQGFFIIVWEDAGLIFLAWFTYDTERPPEDVTAIFGEPGHRWVTALGPFDGDTALLDVFLSSDMILDSALPAVTTEQMEDATIEIVWTGCNEGLLTYNIPTLGLSGAIPIERIVLDKVPACEAAQAQ